MYEFAVRARDREIRKVVPKYNITAYKPPNLSRLHIKIGKNLLCRTRKHFQQHEDKGGIQCTESTRTHTTW